MAGEKGTSNSIGWLELIFQATVLAAMNTLIANAGSPLTQLYVSLHNADPTAAGTQSSNETIYTNYARVSVARTSGGWSIAAETVTNVGAINFPQCGATGDTITYVGVGTASSGAGVLLWAGPLSSSLAVSNGITPSFAASSLTITEG
jgi:hypothetical protein